MSMSTSTAAKPRALKRGLGSFRLWLVALLVVFVSVSLSAPSSTTSAQRVAHLESLVKCPSCQDLSVAQSTSSSSLAVREEIVSLVDRGKSDTQILTTIEAAYGPSILLSPPTSGLGALLWIVPTAVFVGLVTTGIVLRRRR